jgi:hypothetical protein
VSGNTWFTVATVPKYTFKATNLTPSNVHFLPAPLAVKTLDALQVAHGSFDLLNIAVEIGHPFVAAIDSRCEFTTGCG